MTEHCDLAKTSGAVSVATTTTPVLPKNEGRYELTVCNDGANVVYLALATSNVDVAPTATLNSGIRLASGGTWSTRTYRGPISAIAVTGATVITLAEV